MAAARDVPSALTLACGAACSSEAGHRPDQPAKPILLAGMGWLGISLVKGAGPTSRPRGVETGECRVERLT